MSPIDPYLGAQAPTQDFIRTFLDREIPAGLLFYAPFWPQTGNQAWAADKRIVVPTVETVDADGSYFAKDGLIRRARANALRMEGLGALIEGTRTNLQVRSEEFNQNPPWVPTAVTIGTNATPSPDGETTADQMTETIANNFHFIRGNPAHTNGQPHVLTVYAKRGAIRDWIFMFADAAAAQAVAWFNINTGVVGTVAGTSAPWAAIERLPNGWYRCTLGFTAAGGGGRAAGFGLTTADGVIAAYVGSTSAYCYLWGAQFELGAFVTSYIPTAAAAVVRAQENIQYASAGHIAAATGTIFHAITPEGNTTILPANAVTVDIQAANDGVVFYQNTGPNVLTYWVRSGGATVATINSLAALNANQTYIAVGTWALNDFRFYIDGNLQGSDVLGAAPTGFAASIFVGLHRTLVLPGYCNIAHLAIFNRAMSAPEIEQRSHFFRNQMARAS